DRLVLHVHAARGIVADDHDGKPGHDAAVAEPVHANLQLAAQVLRDRLAVDEARAHAASLRSTRAAPVSSMTRSTGTWCGPRGSGPPTKSERSAVTQSGARPRPASNPSKWPAP